MYHAFGEQSGSLGTEYSFGKGLTKRGTRPTSVFNHSHANHMHGHLLANYLDIIDDHLVHLIRRILALISQMVCLGTELPSIGTADLTVQLLKKTMTHLQYQSRQ